MQTNFKIYDRITLGDRQNHGDRWPGSSAGRCGKAGGSSRDARETVGRKTGFERRPGQALASGPRSVGVGIKDSDHPSPLVTSGSRDLVTSGGFSGGSLAPRDLARYLASRSREVISRCASREGGGDQATIRLTPRAPSYYISWLLSKNSLKFLTSVWGLCYLWYLPRY